MIIINDGASIGIVAHVLRNSYTRTTKLFYSDTNKENLTRWMNNISEI